MRKFTLIFFLLMMGSDILAQDKHTPAEKSYEFRDGLFHVIEWKYDRLVTAQMENDEAAFTMHAKDMAYLADLVVEGFELKNSLPENSLARKAIWEDWDTFVEKADTFRENARGLTKAGAMASFNPKKFGRSNCGSCHKEFKQKKE